MNNKHSIVIGVIGADCHAVGNKILEAFFASKGFNVVNLGVMVSHDEFIDAAVESGAKAILVSSLYGHGELDCKGLRERCVERGLDNMILYVGGNLMVGKQGFADVEARFKEMGFDRVFGSDVELEDVGTLLLDDINKVETAEKRG